MQVLRKAVFSAPSSFLALASLRHTVRFACFAAASAEGAAAAADAEGGARAGSDRVAAKPPAMAARARHMAAGRLEKRALICSRITPHG
jgi:hypothetical protein